MHAWLASAWSPSQSAQLLGSGKVLEGVRSTVLLDRSPLRKHGDFRFVFAGQLVSALGSSLTYVALPVQIYQLTKSSAIVGLVGTVRCAARPRPSRDPRSRACASRLSVCHSRSAQT